MEDRSAFFDHALDLDWPWFVEEVRFDDTHQSFFVHLEFEEGGTFTCGTCGDPGCKAYDTVHKQWRHLDFFHYQTYLQGPSPRVNCPKCGIRQAELPWARMWQRVTRSFERMVVSLAREMPIRAVGRVVGEQDTRIGRIVNRHAEPQSP